MNEIKWKKVTNNLSFWKPFAGDVLEGVFVEITANCSPNNSFQYTIQMSDGEQVIVWGCAVLDRAMKLVKIGSPCRIKFLGLVNGKNGKDFKNYEVFAGE